MTPPLRRPHAAATPSPWRSSLAATVVRPGLAGADSRRAALEGLQRPVARGVHRNDAAARRRRRPAQPDHGQPGHDVPRGRRSARRSAFWPAPTWPNMAATTRSPSVVRFINDILLSAPSIVIGLFIYEVMVAPVGHFSGWAGALALAVIVIPVVVRTTEDMLLLVPEHAARSRGIDRPAALEDDHAGRLSRRPSRHDDRRPAGDRAHQRRDRAAAVHRAQQPVLEHQPQRADGEPSGRHLPVRAQPLCRMAAAGLDRRAHHHPRRAGAEHHGARSLPHRENSHEHRGMPYTVPTVAHAPRSNAGPRRARSRCATSTSSTATPRAEGDQRVALRAQGDGLHRPVGLRQVHAAARAQPHVRPLSEPARRPARCCSTARTSCRRSRTSTCCARASAWCSRSRRRSRCRSTRTSPSASALYEKLPKSELDGRVEHALERAAPVGRGQGQAQRQRPEPVGRPAAAAVHRAHRRGAAGGDPVRRAVLGARPDLDRQDRGADRRAEARTTRSSS